MFPRPDELADGFARRSPTENPRAYVKATVKRSCADVVCTDAFSHLIRARHLYPKYFSDR